MYLTWAGVLLVLGLNVGCAAQSPSKPIESLDDRTGITVASLREPIELVEIGTLASGNRSSFAYLGPVEWNRMGEIRYGLWIDVAPGNDQQVSDIHATGAVALLLDDGRVSLNTIDPPQLGQEIYLPAVTWGQSAYFELSAQVLERMAASRKIELVCRGSNAQEVRFLASHDNHAALKEYVRARRSTTE